MCDDQFELKLELNEHIASVHEERNQFKCSLSKAKFDEMPDLNEHIASVHKGKKPFKCEECDVQF